MKKPLLAAAGIVIATALLAALMLSVQEDDHHADDPPQTDAYGRAEENIHEILERDGVRAALDELTRIAKSDTELAGQCHGLAHGIGHEALEHEGFERALTFEDDICGSGYLHGVIEAHFAETPEDEIPALFAKTCPPQSGKCFHGLGHGAMASYDNDVAKSLALCHSLTQSFQRIQCAEGVFMEHFASDGSAHPSPLLIPEDPYRACRGQSDADRGVCAFYVPRYLLHLNPGAYVEAVDWCNLIDEPSRAACIKGVGSAAMKEHVSEPAVAIAACAELTGDDHALCIEGLVSYTIVHFASPAKGRELCASLPADDRAACERISSESEPFYGE